MEHQRCCRVTTLMKRRQAIGTEQGVKRYCKPEKVYAELRMFPSSRHSAGFKFFREKIVEIQGDLSPSGSLKE